MQSAGTSRLSQINQIADQLLASSHSQSAQIRQRRQATNDKWAQLQAVRERKAQMLAKAASVAEFERMCEQTRAWMDEKAAMLHEPMDADDLKALQAQQRRHQNLERELKPVEEQMAALRLLADRVAKENPGLAQEIERQVGELQRMWLELNKRALERRHLLEEGQGQQMFTGACEELRAWIRATLASLGEAQRPADVAEAERMLERHYELKDEMRQKRDEFAYVRELGERLLRKSAGLQDVKVGIAGTFRE